MEYRSELASYNKLMAARTTMLEADAVDTDQANVGPHGAYECCWHALNPALSR